VSLNYDKVNVTINGDYILAESVSINQESPQKPLYILDNLRPYDNTPQGIKTTINMTYYVEPYREPTYKIISGWKTNNNTGNLTCSLTIGEMPFVGFLNSYSFDILPNSPIKVQASYIAFNENTALMENQPDSSDSNLYNLQNGTGIAHYWAINLTSGTGFAPIDNHNILQLNYSFTSNILPSYKLGSAFPAQVSVLEATEEINLVNETQNNVKFTGQPYNVIFNNIDNIRLKNLSSLWGDVNKSIDFNISGYEIQTSKVDISNESLVLFQHNLKKYY